MGFQDFKYLQFPGQSHLIASISRVGMAANPLGIDHIKEDLMQSIAFTYLGKKCLGSNEI